MSVGTARIVRGRVTWPGAPWRRAANWHATAGSTKLAHSHIAPWVRRGSRYHSERENCAEEKLCEIRAAPHRLTKNTATLECSGTLSMSLRCKPRSCPAMKSIADGKLAKCAGNGTLLPHGFTCAVVCNRGYLASGRQPRCHLGEKKMHRRAQCFVWCTVAACLGTSDKD